MSPTNRINCFLTHRFVSSYLVFWLVMVLLLVLGFIALCLFFVANVMIYGRFEAGPVEPLLKQPAVVIGFALLFVLICIGISSTVAYRHARRRHKTRAN